MRSIIALLFLVLPVCGQSQELRFVSEDLPPLHFRDQQGKPSGMLVDVSQAVLRNAGLSASIEFLPQARVFDTTLKQPDTFMMSLLRSAERDSEFQWVGEVYHTKASLVGLKNRDDIQVDSLEQAKAYIVGTIRGYHSEDYLRHQGFTPKRNLSLAVQYDQMWGMLFHSHTELVLTNVLFKDQEVLKAGFDPELLKEYLPLPELSRPLYIATGLQTSPETVAKLRDALKQLKASGEYEQILHKWGL